MIKDPKNVKVELGRVEKLTGTRMRVDGVIDVAPNNVCCKIRICGGKIVKDSCGRSDRVGSHELREGKIGGTEVAKSDSASDEDVRIGSIVV